MKLVTLLFRAQNVPTLLERYENFFLENEMFAKSLSITITASPERSRCRQRLKIFKGAIIKWEGVFYNHKHQRVVFFGKKMDLRSLKPVSMA